ncbi:MAG: hypothetical protein KAV87_03700 [Desulfobacteraceae bacterium]|nr:hypothetical protein [Desulfobacteraceae bacterium]
MITQYSVPFKEICLWSLIIACGLIAAYLCFISLVSIWIGIGHIHQSGFWVPVLAGTSFLIAVFLAFLRIAKRILSHMKQKDALSL